MVEEFSDGLERCRNRHIRTPENTIFERSRNGNTRRRCRDCRRESRAQRAGRPAGLEGLSPRVVRQYSELTQEEQRTVDRFDRGLKLVGAKCAEIPTEYSDYDEENIPSPETARKLCEGCPLIDLCQDAAKVMQHNWSVWGGEVWVYGKEYIKGTE